MTDDKTGRSAQPAQAVGDRLVAFENWYARENETANNHMEGDDWLELDPGERDNYRAAFDAGVAHSRRVIAPVPAAGATAVKDVTAANIETLPIPYIGHGLDFEPDTQHTVTDMANVGYSRMQAIKLHRPSYCWNDSPSEIVGDLVEEIDEKIPTLKAPENEGPLKLGDRSLQSSLERLKAAYVIQQPAPIPDQMALVWRFDIGRLRDDWIRLNSWQEELMCEEEAAKTDLPAAPEPIHASDVPVAWMGNTNGHTDVVIKSATKPYNMENAKPLVVLATHTAPAVDAVPGTPTLRDDEIEDFKVVVEDFEDNGETAVDYVLLMDWARRGLLECVHFEVTKAGRDALNAAKATQEAAKGEAS